MTDAERAHQLKRNEEFVSLPNPKLNDLSNEQLENRADILEATFSDLFDGDE